MNETNEFSFILKPSELQGIGVFAAHDISKGTHLALFAEEDKLDTQALERNKDAVPEVFQQYCLDWGDKLICPKNFSAMPVGWYLNHSKASNAARDENFKWFAAKDIKAGEEITIDYNTLNEAGEVNW